MRAPYAGVFVPWSSGVLVWALERTSSSLRFVAVPWEHRASRVKLLCAHSRRCHRRWALLKPFQTPCARRAVPVAVQLTCPELGGAFIRVFRDLLGRIRQHAGK